MEKELKLFFHLYTKEIRKLFDVIIVDDEPLIRDGLVKLFSWKEYQMQVRAVFPNGSLALEYLEKQSADVIITDIKMPVMNGIQLMQECQKKNILVKFIVLSGYSNFEYVKMAARLGIENYLLKPVDTLEMSQTLLQVKRKIEAQRHNKILLDEGIRILRNNLLYRLMTGEISYEEIEERKEYLPIPFDSCLCRVAILKFLPQNPDTARHGQQKPPIQSVLRHLEQKEYIHAVTDFGGRLLFLLFCGEGGICSSRETVRADLEHIIHYVLATSPFHAFAAAGPLADSIYTIPNSYAKASALINTAGFNSASSIRWAEDTCENEAFLLPHIEFDQLMQLNEKFLYKKQEDIVSIVDEIFSTNRFIPLDGLQMLASMIVSKIYSNSRAYSSDHDPEILRLENRLDDAYTLGDYDSIYRWTRDIIHTIFVYEERNPSEKAPSGATNLKKILLYLNENYTKDMNLKTIAETFHLNALYLGRILKLETGCTFTDYINSLRLKKAQELLLHTDLSAKQISEQTGYRNDKYFNTLFKKYTDMTPGEYRKKGNPS